MMENNTGNESVNNSRHKLKKKNIFNIETLSNALHDPSLWTLLFANLYAIYVIHVSHASLVSVLLIYWFQSIIIGIFTIIRILCLKSSTNNVSESSGKVALTATKNNASSAFWFFIGYGIFHYTYYFIIWMYGSARGEINSSTFISILPIVMIFFLNHLFSFIHSFKEQTTNQNSDEIAKAAIDRIGPMHITLMFIFAIGKWSILPFLFLKTYFDIYGHIVKHAKRQ